MSVMFKHFFNDIAGQIALVNNKFLLLDYQKIPKPKESVSGYRKKDLEAVAARYLVSSKGLNEKKLLTISAFSDIKLFLNTDCKKVFRGNKRWKILDVGCGSGLYSKLFNGKSFPYGKVQYEGCEIDRILVDACKKINPKMNFFVSFADAIKSPDKNYDIVFSSSVLHYTLSKWKKSIKESTRVSKKYILISRVPFSKYHETFYVQQIVRSLQGTEQHYFVVINRSEFEDYVGKLGLKILARDYSSEQYKIRGVNEKVMLMEYLLSK